MKKKRNFLLPLLMAIVMMAMSPTRMWADSQLTYTATSDLSALFESVFGDGGTWTDKDTPVKITISGTVTSIGENAFSRCPDLTSITIPEGVTSIGDNVFSGCSDLTTVTVLSNNLTLGKGAFDDCNSLQNIYVPKSSVATYKSATNWSDYASKINAIPAASVTTSAGATTFYDTFAAAFAAATDGSTITLYEDVTIEDRSEMGDPALEIMGEKYPTNGLTIDLGQNKLSLQNYSQYTYAIQIYENNKLTIKNGTLYFKDFQTGIVTSSPITFDGVSIDGTDLKFKTPNTGDLLDVRAIYSQHADIVLNNSTVTVPSGNYSYFNHEGINGNNSLTLTGTSKMDGNIKLHNCTVKAASTATIANCTMYVDGESKGTLSIANGTFTAPTDYKWTAGSDGLSTLSQHKIVQVTVQDATCTTDGYTTACWRCSDCGTCFSDEAGTTKIEASTVVIPATGHNYVEGVCTECGDEKGIIIYTSVQQDGTKLDQLGTAAFKIKYGSAATLEFVDGKAVMTSGTTKVAELPMSDKGEMVLEFSTTVPAADLNKVSKTVTAAGYATLYSPFQLAVPAEGDVEVYAPTYDESAHTLSLKGDNKVNGYVIPAGTGVLLKNAGNATFTITADAATYTDVSALTGSALKIANPTKEDEVEGKTVYTLGKNSSNDYGFFRYKGDYLNAGSAFLYIETLPTEGNVKGISLIFGDEDETTLINNEKLIINNEMHDGKYLENGRVVIIRNGKKYSTSGQRMK